MSERIPFVQIDTSGAPTLDGVANEEALAGTEAGLLILGKDGSDNAQIIKTDADGAVAITDNAGSLTVDDGGGSLTIDGSIAVSNFPATQPVSGSVSVSNLPATQAVSAAALPLPTGAATETTLAALNTKTPSLGQAAMAASQPVVIASNQSAVPITDNSGSLTVDSTQLPAALVGGRLSVDGSGVTQPVSGSVSITGTPNVAVTSSTLPTGAATETTLSALSAKLSSLGQKAMAASTPVVLASDQSTVPVSVSGVATETTLSAINTKTPALAAGRVPVDGSGVTQPVSGTVTATISGTPNVAVTSSALPTGAATDATLTGGTQKAINRGGAKGSTTAADVTSTASGANHQALDVVIYDVSGNPITSFGSSTVSVSNFPATQPVSAASLPLPTGAATSAKQPALGTAGTPATDVLTVQGAASMTALKVDGSAVTQPVSGTVTANIGTTNGLALDSTLTGNNARTRLTDGTNIAAVKAASTAPVAADPAVVVAISPNTALGALADTTISGTIAVLGGTVVTGDLSGQGSGTLAISGTFGATLQFEGSVDGTNWTALPCRLLSGVAVTTSTNTTGAYRFACGGLTGFRIRSSAYTSGTVVITIRTSPSAAAVALSDALPPGNNTIGAVTQSGTWNPDVTGGSANLNALNAVAFVVMAGRQGCSATIAAGTLTGTVVPEHSVDNGNNYTSTYFVDPLTDAKSSSLVFTNPNVVTSRNILVTPGTTHARVRVSAWTSGTASTTLRATSIAAPTSRLEAGVVGSATPPNAVLVAGTDGTNLAALTVKPASTPAVATDRALVVATIAPPTATLTNVSTSTTSVTLLSADLTRRAATIANDASAILYVKFGATASSTSYTVALAPAVSGVPSYYEVLQGYTGRIDAVLATGTGTARITALT